MEQIAKMTQVVVFSERLRDAPLNPDFWNIRRLDTKNAEPERATHAHGIITFEDPALGSCLMVNKDTDGEHTFFNLIGGSVENNEQPKEGFIREMIEETGVAPETSRVHYMGMIETDHPTGIPLYSYRLSPDEVRMVTKTPDTEFIGLLPLASIKKEISEDIYNALFAAGS